MRSTRHWRRSASRWHDAQDRRALCRRRRHAARRLCAGARGLELLVGRRGSGVLRAIQRLAAIAGTAGRRGGGERCGERWTWRCAAARRAKADSRSGSTLADRVSRAPSRSGRSPPCSVCEPPRGALDELRGAHPMSRWVSLWISAFEAGPWRCAIVGRAPSINRPNDFANCWRRSRPAIALFGTHSRQSAEGILRRAARDTAFQVADRHSADLGERPIARPVARLRWSMDHRMRRGTLAAAGRPDSSAARAAAETVWSDRRGSAFAAAIRRGLAAALAAPRRTRACSAAPMPATAAMPRRARCCRRWLSAIARRSRRPAPQPHWLALLEVRPGARAIHR